jgi:hypothetical protein
VSLLPYLEQQHLYNQFHLNEPWDSPHNIQLLKHMPEVYAPPGASRAKPYATFYQLFVGKGAAFQKHQHATFASFTDGTSNTILIVEAGTPVPWTKPEDLHYAPDEPLPELGGIFPNVFNAAFADGAVWTLKKGCPEPTLRWAIDPADGHVLDLKECKALADQRLAEFVGKGQTELERQNKALQEELRRAREQVEQLKIEKGLQEEVAREKAKLGKDATDPLVKENAQLRQALRQVQTEIGRLAADVQRLRGGKEPAPPGAERPAAADPSAQLERLQRQLDEQERRSRAEAEQLREEIRRLRQQLKK